MDNAVAVEVVEGLDELLGDFTHLMLTKIPIVLQDLEQFSLREFGHDAELVRRLERIKEKNDVLVVETLENLDFLTEVVHFLFGLAPAHDKTRDFR